MIYYHLTLQHPKRIGLIFKPQYIRNSQSNRKPRVKGVLFGCELGPDIQSQNITARTQKEDSLIYLFVFL